MSFLFVCSKMILVSSYLYFKKNLLLNLCRKCRIENIQCTYKLYDITNTVSNYVIIRQGQTFSLNFPEIDKYIKRRFNFIFITHTRFFVSKNNFPKF